MDFGDVGIPAQINTGESAVTQSPLLPFLAAMAGLDDDRALNRRNRGRLRHGVSGDDPTVLRATLSSLTGDEALLEIPARSHIDLDYRTSCASELLASMAALGGTEVSRRAKIAMDEQRSGPAARTPAPMEGGESVANARRLRENSEEALQIVSDVFQLEV